jgi:hypothetical protein
MRVLLASTLLLSALACGGEEFVSAPTSSQGGQAGAGGSGGGSAQAGDSGAAGTSGEGGSTSEGGAAGSAGDGGAGQSGAAGDGGTAGNGGTAGTAGAAGDGGTAGNGGAAGDGGAAGTTPAGAGGDGGTAGGGGSAGDGGAAGDGGNGGAAGSGTVVCEGTQFLCNNACVDESVEHCGGCNPCAASKDPLAEAACAEGKCKNVCAPGFAFAAGRCRDFGGWYVTYKDQNGATQCSSENGMNNNQCTCPNGFNKVPLGYIPQPGISPADVEAIQLSVCAPAAIVGDLTKPAGDWGGAFLREVGTGICRWGNPYRSDLQCGCPLTGSWVGEKIPLKESNSSKDLEFTLCRRSPPTGAPTYLGAFAKFSDDNVVDGFFGKNCYAPLGDNQCACPEGSFSTPIKGKFYGKKEGFSLFEVRPSVVSVCLPNGLLARAGSAALEHAARVRAHQTTAEGFGASSARVGGAPPGDLLPLPIEAPAHALVAPGQQRRAAQGQVRPRARLAEEARQQPPRRHLGGADRHPGAPRHRVRRRDLGREHVEGAQAVGGPILREHRLDPELHRRERGGLQPGHQIAGICWEGGPIDEGGRTISILRRRLASPSRTMHSRPDATTLSPTAGTRPASCISSPPREP